MSISVQDFISQLGVYLNSLQIDHRPFSTTISLACLDQKTGHIVVLVSSFRTKLLHLPVSFDWLLTFKEGVGFKRTVSSGRRSSPTFVTNVYISDLH